MVEILYYNKLLMAIASKKVYLYIFTHFMETHGINVRLLASARS